MVEIKTLVKEEKNWLKRHPESERGKERLKHYEQEAKKHEVANKMNSHRISDSDEFYTPKGMFRKYGYVTQTEKGKYWGRTKKASQELAKK